MKSIRRRLAMAVLAGFVGVSAMSLAAPSAQASYYPYVTTAVAIEKINRHAEHCIAQMIELGQADADARYVRDLARRCMFEINWIAKAQQPRCSVNGKVPTPRGRDHYYSSCAHELREYALVVRALRAAIADIEQIRDEVIGG